MSEAASSSKLILVCVSGPDAGKRLAIGEARATLGRGVACNIVSDDADVISEHVAFTIVNGSPVYEPMNNSLVFVDGQASASGPLLAGKQLRFGRSYWQLVPEGGDDSITAWVDKLSGQITTAAGLEKIKGFSLVEFFSQVFKRHGEEEIEEYFMVGSPKSTPPIRDVDDRWPSPWVFGRMIFLSLLVYGAFVFAFYRFDYNENLIPGLITVGSFAIPGSLLIFYFEMNTPRNVSLYMLVKTVLLGGVASIMLSLLVFKLADDITSWFGPPSAGVVEEIGKAAALLLVVRKFRYRWILNGMLFGAAVGTGFAAFESAGYALRAGGSYGADAMIENINLRGMLSVCGGHVMWTALVGAALWRVRGDQPFRFSMVKDQRFWRVLLLVMVTHALWNSRIPSTFYIKYIVLGFVAWVATLAYIQTGLKQVQAEKVKLASAGAPVSAVVTTLGSGAGATTVVAAASESKTPPTTPM